MNKEKNDIDIFVAQNLEAVEVEFNPAHWENMQKMLAAAALTAAAVSATQPAAKTAGLQIAKIIKVALIASATVASIAIGSYVLLKKNKTKTAPPPSVVKPIAKPVPIDSFKPVTIPLPPLPENTIYYKDKPVPAVAPKPIVKDSVIALPKTIAAPKDSVFKSVKDTTKKKDLNVFW